MLFVFNRFTRSRFQRTARFHVQVMATQINKSASEGPVLVFLKPFFTASAPMSLVAFPSSFKMRA